MFRDTQPDIALLDIRMPEIDACTLIRNESDVPITMFSDVDEPADVLLALQRGADDYVLKDTGFRELLNRVAKHIKRYSTDILITQPANRGAGRIVPFSPGQSARSRAERPRGDLKSLNVQTVTIEADSASGDPAEKFVIIAHSDPESLTQLAEIAGRTGFEVAQPTTGREAVVILATRRPRLIVVGSELADMNCVTVI
jgi:DNA-binding response OmpR family regulator